MISRWIKTGSALVVALGLCKTTHAQTAVTIDAKRAHQTMYGFGATTLSLAFGATKVLHCR